jgi:hypothetical protein
MIEWASSDDDKLITLASRPKGRIAESQMAKAKDLSRQ